MAMTASLSTLSFLSSSAKHTCRYLVTSHPFVIRRRSQDDRGQLVVRAATKGSTKQNKSDEKIPAWARPDSDEPPPWERDGGSGRSTQSTIQIPFYAYLLASAITAIAAIGSVFEYVNSKPVFGVVNSESIFYVPLLGFFAFTGIPTSAYLWYKSVQVANEEAEEQDRRDGYL